MMDVYLVAVDWKANPITEWTVRSHPGREELATVVLEDGRYRLRTVLGGLSTHGGLLEARNFAASLFSFPSAAH